MVRPVWILAGGLAALGALCDLCFRIERPAIEDDLTARVTAALASSEPGAGWLDRVSVLAEGQTILLNGKTPNAEARSRAVQLASQVWGVDRVIDELKVSAFAGDSQVPLAPPSAEVTEAARNCQVDFDQALAKGRIEFAAATSLLEEWSYPALDRISQIAGSCPAASIEVAGHADDGDDETGNRRLSQARAEAVVYYLLRKGVHPARLVARGHGSTHTLPERKGNGRIELRVNGL